MGRNSIVRDSLVIGIIFLFIGVTAAPIVSITRASDSNDCVQITAQACGMKGFENATVKLSREKYQDLEQRLVDFKLRLDQATTSEQIGKAFNDMIVVLETYGLLPKHMRATQAQQLVTEQNQNRLVPFSYQKITGESQLLNHSNFFCLIAGETTANSLQFDISEMGCSVLCWLLYTYAYLTAQWNDDMVVINKTISFLKSMRDLIYKINLKRITGLGVITFGHSHPSSVPPPYRYDPAVGWVTTVGLLGKRSWNGSFFGGIFRIVPFASDSYAYYIGALGFVGIKLYKGNGGYFFLGTTAHVKLVYSDE